MPVWMKVVLQRWCIRTSHLPKLIPNTNWTFNNKSIIQSNAFQDATSSRKLATWVWSPAIYVKPLVPHSAYIHSQAWCSLPFLLIVDLWGETMMFNMSNIWVKRWRYCFASFAPIWVLPSNSSFLQTHLFHFGDNQTDLFAVSVITGNTKWNRQCSDHILSMQTV